MFMCVCIFVRVWNSQNSQETRVESNIAEKEKVCVQERVSEWVSDIEIWWVGGDIT